MRDDLEILVAEAHKLGYYTNLITSGIGLNENAHRALKEAGLDHIQLSFQDSTREVNDFLSSTRTFDLKRKVATLIKQHGYPMVLNCRDPSAQHRPHRRRSSRWPTSSDADYLELANTQYLRRGRTSIATSCCRRASSSMRAEAVTNRFRERLGAKMKHLLRRAGLLRERARRNA